MKATLFKKRLISLGLLVAMGLLFVVFAFHKHNGPRSPAEHCAICEHLNDHPATTTTRVVVPAPRVTIAPLTEWLIVASQSAPKPEPLGRSPPR